VQQGRTTGAHRVRQTESRPIFSTSREFQADGPSQSHFAGKASLEKFFTLDFFVVALLLCAETIQQLPGLQPLIAALYVAFSCVAHLYGHYPFIEKVRVKWDKIRPGTRLDGERDSF
jgi:hypothetical protein